MDKGEALALMRGLFREIKISTAEGCYLCTRRVKDYVSQDAVVADVQNNIPPRDVAKLVDQLGNAIIYMMDVDVRRGILTFGIKLSGVEPYAGYSSCNSCMGHGHIRERCPYCNGQGHDTECNCWGTGFTPCKACDGYGKVQTGKPVLPEAASVAAAAPDMYKALMVITDLVIAGNAKLPIQVYLSALSALHKARENSTNG